MEIITKEEMFYLRLERARKDLRKRRAFEEKPVVIKTVADLKEKYKGNEELIRALMKKKCIK